MGLRNRTFTDEQFIEAVKDSFSIAEVLRKVSLIAAGANYRMFRVLVKKLNIDHSHFTGQGYLKGKTHNNNKSIPLKDILIENSSYKNIACLKKRLLKEKKLENKCHLCGIDSWLNKSISLHLHHVNGTENDHRIENLQLLCPNCHSQTDNYCGRGIKEGTYPLKAQKHPKQIKPKKLGISDTAIMKHIKKSKV